MAAAFTRSPERAAAFGARFAFPLCDDLEKIARDPDIDCVLIATPPSSHLELVRQFARAGKHILLEKPLEVSGARAETWCPNAKLPGSAWAWCCSIASGRSRPREQRPCGAQGTSPDRCPADVRPQQPSARGLTLFTAAIVLPGVL